MNRKKRNDRNHIVYEIVNTENGKSYIGITAAIGRRFHYSAKLRLQKHFSRARKENKNWDRFYSDEDWSWFITNTNSGGYGTIVK